jgi:hypothetical protein
VFINDNVSATASVMNDEEKKFYILLTPGACTIKLFMAVIVAVSYKVSVCHSIHFHSNLIFVGKAGAYQSGSPYRTPP